MIVTLYSVGADNRSLITRTFEEHGFTIITTRKQYDFYSRRCSILIPSLNRYECAQHLKEKSAEIWNFNEQDTKLSEFATADFFINDFKKYEIEYLIAAQIDKLLTSL